MRILRSRIQFEHFKSQCLKTLEFYKFILPREAALVFQGFHGNLLFSTSKSIIILRRVLTVLTGLSPLGISSVMLTEFWLRWLKPYPQAKTKHCSRCKFSPPTTYNVDNKVIFPLLFRGDGGHAIQLNYYFCPLRIVASGVFSGN